MKSSLYSKVPSEIVIGKKGFKIVSKAHAQINVFFANILTITDISKQSDDVFSTDEFFVFDVSYLEEHTYKKDLVKIKIEHNQGAYERISELRQLITEGYTEALSIKDVELGI